MTIQQLRQKRSELIALARAILDAAGEAITDEQQADYDAKTAEIEKLSKRIEAEERQAKLDAEVAVTETRGNHAPAVLTAPLGDSEERAYAYFLRTGDYGAIQKRASNATDMNIGTPADGGYAVPTGHYQGIIARRDESLLAAKLGVRAIPGKGTTVNVPVDAEDDGEFVSTNEAAESDLDAPALNTVAMTLATYTKRVYLSNQLLRDEDSKLLAFLADFVGRGIAKTHNSLLLAAVAADGTKWSTFAGATAIAAAEPEAIIGIDALGAYLDDAGSVQWVMRNSTHAAIKAITGNARMYAEQTSGVRELLGYPVQYSAKAGAMTAGLNSVFFGNWNFVGMREDPGLTVLRDPYSRASYGQVVLHYYFSAVYKVLQAEAIGYSTQHA